MSGAICRSEPIQRPVSVELKICSRAAGAGARAQGSGCTFASLDGGRSWREWAGGERRPQVPRPYPRSTIDANFIPALGPMQQRIGAPFFTWEFTGLVGIGPNATHLPGGGFKSFRATVATALEFPIASDDTGIPARLAPMGKEVNITYVGLPWPVRDTEFNTEGVHGDMMETADGGLLHVVSVAWNPTFGCNHYECNRGDTLKKNCVPINFICNRGSIVAFRSVDGGECLSSVTWNGPLFVCTDVWFHNRPHFRVRGGHRQQLMVWRGQRRVLSRGRWRARLCYATGWHCYHCDAI